MIHLSDEGVKSDIKNRTPTQATLADAIEFLTFSHEDVEDVVRRDVQVLKDEEMLDGLNILGFVFDTETGELKQVC